MLKVKLSISSPQKMQIFELHFNPKLKENQFLDSFIYEPAHSYEKKLGSIYMVGELENALPSNSRFLENLAQVVKKNYYQLSFQTAEKAFSQTLKKVNQFLAEEVKKENVSWLGNLNFAVLSLKNSDLIFTKTGNLKILLIRRDEIIDLSKNLNHQDIEPYPLKVFFSLVSGKLVQDDIILILTKDVFKFFSAQNLLTKISQAKEFNKKNLKEILPVQLFNKGEGAKISGVCLLIHLKEKVMPGEEIIYQKEKKFSFSEALSPFLIPFQKIKEFFQKRFNFLSKIKNKLKKRQTIFQALINPVAQKITLIKQIPEKITKNIPFISRDKKTTSKEQKKESEKPKARPKLDKSLTNKLSSIFLTKETIKKTNVKKKLILVLALIFILGLGFLSFKGIEQKREKEIKAPLNKVQEKVNLAESFLIIKNQERANTLFKEAWLTILPLTEKKTSLKPEIISLKEKIEKNLKELNKLEEIEEPEEVSNSQYQKLFSPLLLPKNLELPSDKDFNPDLSVSYLRNFYLLDKKTCKIVKYPFLKSSSWASPRIWKEPNNHCYEPKSMTIDGSIWILNNDNSIARYHKGKYQETIKLDIFPIIKNISEIKTKPDNPYLYLLEPANQRLIIIDKETKKNIRQFQGKKFDNLKTIAISQDGKIIYLLNNDKIYKIELD